MTMFRIPRGKKLAWIGGSSLVDSPILNHADSQRVPTPYAEVVLLQQGSNIFLQRHGLEDYTPPHRMNHHAHIHALKSAGADGILALGSVGSLSRDIPPGSIMIPDDFLAPQASLTFHDDHRGHRTPGFHPGLRHAILEAWKRTTLPPPLVRGVYWQTQGPRFETPAEIRFYSAHAQVVGMTLANECILAAEMELPYAAICVVDNYANGIHPTPLTFESFMAQVEKNRSLTLQIVQQLSDIFDS